ncbi:anti-sigma factor [Erythrobacter sp. BLCC-B19]|uniref:anti-sigma factor n=1 Tax=Erythrobacter sp. BLCC-B19 TaxID=3025315 RepID=UPI0023626A51|nr:anti-sigma factor [Erythrobacter sp. BLCC-B19]WDA41637.1 anti-sigma factor [Erythrobacter sp. BLCC-B19]
MSGPEQTPEDGVTRDDPMIAAEWALGLLEGEELLAARGKYATDPAFAWRKEWWDDWFAPLSDAIPGAEPGDHVWDGIAARVSAAQAAVSTEPSAPAANVVELQAKVRRWQWVAGISSMAAAVALAFLAIVPMRIEQTPAAPIQVAAAAPMVATVPVGDSGLRLDVTYIPESKRMVVGAIGLTPDGVHDHELWLVPADGTPLQSLGVVKPGEVRSMELPQAVTAKLGDGASLVLTREPIGGKPEGKDAGPVVAKGAFTRV